MKIKYLLLLITILLIVSGCKFKKSDIHKDIIKKYNNPDSYYLTGNLEILNNEDLFKYEVVVNYKKDDMYKVSLKNINNNNEQIILKNKDGVFVLTPALNKSFKFQSNWPYNNSQIYLLKSIMDDLKNDKERTYSKDKDKIIYITKVNYPNNRKLINQKIELDNKLNLKAIDVQDENGISYMKMTFTEIKLNEKIDDDIFKVENIIDNSETKKETKKTSKLEDIVYPLYLPSGTKLSNKETIKNNNGERVILSFDGEKPFMLIEETSKEYEDFEIIPTFGEPCLLSDTVAALTENSITWSSNNIDYYIVSDVMSKEELLDIARSVQVIPTMK